MGISIMGVDTGWVCQIHRCTHTCLVGVGVFRGTGVGIDHHTWGYIHEQPYLYF